MNWISRRICPNESIIFNARIKLRCNHLLCAWLCGIQAFGLRTQLYSWNNHRSFITQTELLLRLISETNQPGAAELNEVPWWMRLASRQKSVNQTICYVQTFFIDYHQSFLGKNLIVTTCKHVFSCSSTKRVPYLVIWNAWNLLTDRRASKETHLIGSFNNQYRMRDDLKRFSRFSHRFPVSSSHRLSS